MSVNIELSNIEEPNSIAIPAKLILDTLKTFPDIPLTFNIDTASLIVEISAGEGKYKLAGSAPDEFPKIPVIESIGVAEIPASILSMAINKTLFAAGNDDLRPMMSGVYCQLSPDGTTFVATDAHKLVKYTRKDVVVEEEAAIILPKKPLNQLKNTLGTSDDTVKLAYNQTNAFFKFGNIELVCRLIEGRYPNYEAVIPTENPNVLVVERSLILSSMRRVALFANQSTHQVRFRISGQEMFLSAEDVEYANQANERLACQYTGEDMEIGFNSKFILEMLNNLEGENIALQMSVPTRPGILLPVDNEDENEDLLMLVMPVMLNV